MAITKYSIVAATAAMALVACSDNPASNALEEAENAYQETISKTYICAADSSVVTDQSLCPTVTDPVTGEVISGAIDSTVTKTITCSDGSVVNDASLCPQTTTSSSSQSSQNSSSSIVAPSGDDDDDDGDVEDAKELDGTEVLFTLSGTTATVTNGDSLTAAGCITLADGSVTITCPGDYYFTGTSTDFQVIVNTPGTDGEGNTGVYLYNATIKSSNAPILVKNADKTVLHLVKGTTNAVEDGSSVHEFLNKNNVNDTASAAIYSKDDLNIKGAGKLTVTGNYKNGIQCSNDLKIKNGNITVVADTNGIKGKGSLVISGGTLNVTATYGDGLKSDECNEDANDSCTSFIEGKGIVLISGGEVTITKAGDDGIQAANYIYVTDTSETTTITVNSTGKGLTSDNMVYVEGGTLTVNSSDDGIAAKMNIWMDGGDVTISASPSATTSTGSTSQGWGGQQQSSSTKDPKSQGIHADSTLYLNGSTLNIVTAEEGIEAYVIRAQAGITATYATNDGWNAAGGSVKYDVGTTSSNTGMGNMGNMGGGGGSSSYGAIIITGGYHYISASGSDIDVLDANGSALQQGGVLILEIPSSTSSGMGGMGSRGGSTGSGCSTNNSGGLIDTDDGYEISGGVMIGFGSQTEEYPNCSSTSYTAGNYYGSSNAAATPKGSGSMVIYGGSVSSIGQVETSGMTEVKFPNGVSYMYK